MESLQCPNCSCKQSSVLETREMTFYADNLPHVLKIRKRQCRYCKYQYWSKEMTDDNITFSEHSNNRKPPSPQSKPTTQPVEPESSTIPIEDIPPPDPIPELEPFTEIPPIPAPEFREIERPLEDELVPKKRRGPYKKKGQGQGQQQQQKPPIKQSPPIRTGEDFFPPVD